MIRVTHQEDSIHIAEMNKQIHYQNDVLERFIPISLERLTADLLDSGYLPPEQHAPFQRFCLSYSVLFHAQTHSRLKALQTAYQPFNPDREELIGNNAGSETERQLAQFKEELTGFLEKANFEKLSEDALNEALNKISPHGVKVSVDFDEFADVALFYRGAAIVTELRRNWARLQFKKQPVDIKIYRRLFVLLQPKTKQRLIEDLVRHKKMSQKKAEKKARSGFKMLGVEGTEDVVYMKLFKDIPTADLETLFPNTRIQMPLFDKLKLGIMGGGGTAGGVMATISKFSAAIDPVSALIAIGGFLGVLWRQISKIFSQRAKYSAILTRNLYFYSLDNNLGALTYLFNAAEAEECKEALLAYFFLLAHGPSSREKLDKRIEDFIFQQYAIPMDFEIDDGLNKLDKSELLDRAGNRFQAVSLPEANARLTRLWNRVIEEQPCQK